jgi:hypothetical protein
MDVVSRNSRSTINVLNRNSEETEPIVAREELVRGGGRFGECVFLVTKEDFSLEIRRELCQLRDRAHRERVGQNPCIGFADAINKLTRRGRKSCRRLECSAIFDKLPQIKIVCDLAPGDSEDYPGTVDRLKVKQIGEVIDVQATKRLTLRVRDVLERPERQYRVQAGSVRASMGDE